MIKLSVKKGVAAVLLTAVCAVSSAFGINGLTGGGLFKAEAANADYNNSGFTNLGKLFDGTTVNKNVLSVLYGALSPDDAATFNGVEAALAANNGHVNAEILRGYNENKDITVTFSTSATYNNGSGGTSTVSRDLDWTVTYLSRDLNGNVIATLWLNDAGHLGDITADRGSSIYAPYSGGYYGGLDTTYPASFYGSSLVRAVLTGGTYSHGKTATVYVGDVNVTASSQTGTSTTTSHNLWYNMRTNYSKYMVQPKDVSWQISALNGVEPLKQSVGYDKSFPNSYLDSRGQNFPASGDFTAKGLESNNTTYSAWGEDYLWLPSSEEVGYLMRDTDVMCKGLWGSSLQQIQNDGGVNSDNLDTSTKRGAYNGTWLRTADIGDPSGACLINADGRNNYGFPNICLMVRPAFHLNLTKLYEETKAAASTENGDLIEAWNNAVETSLTNDGAQVTFTLTRDWTAAADETYTTSFGAGTGFNSGMLYVPQGANVKLNLNGYTLDRNLTSLEQGINHGRAVYVSGGTLEIADPTGGGKITGGNAWREDGTSDVLACGGGVLVRYGGKLTLSGGNITGNKSIWGGAVFVRDGATLVINGGSLSSNRTEKSGGAVHAYLSDSTVIVNGGLIYGNVAETVGGGGIYLNAAAHAIVNGGYIRGNTTPFTGGGLCAMGQDADIMINGGTVCDNQAQWGGGAAAAGGTGANVSLTVNGGTIQGNYATVTGGGIYSNANAKITEIDGGLITRNDAKDHGGGVYSDSAVVMRGGEISYNQLVSTEGTFHQGGGVTIGNDGTFTMYDGQISHNEATSAGAFGSGVALCGTQTSTIYGGSITHNVSRGAAGGINVIGAASLVIWDGVISRNTSIVDGGAGVCTNTTGNLTINGGLISENTAPNYGGGVYIYNGVFALNGGRITGNMLTEGTSGGGVYCWAGSDVNNEVRVTGGVVAGNKKADGTASNLMPWSYKTGYTIAVAGKLAPDTLIMVTGVTAGKAVTKGFTSSGNVAADVNTKIVSDQKTALTLANGEIVWNGGDSRDILDNLVWTLSDGTTSESSHIEKVYSPQKSYTLSCSGSTVAEIRDETGRTVTAISKVGNYYATAVNAGLYVNGVVCIEIKARDIAEATASVASAVYDGTPVTPNISLSLGGETLREGVDYNVTYSNNINAGDGACAHIAGIGNYCGLLNKTFTVERRNLNVRWGDTSKIYNGSAQYMTAVIEGAVAGDKVGLTLSYTDEEGNYVAAPTNAGVYFVYAKLNYGNNYKFANNIDYYSQMVIGKKPVDISLEEFSSVYDGNAKTVKPYFVDIGGERRYLAESAFTLSGKLTDGKAVHAGEYAVDITATSSDDGNYVYASANTLYYNVEKALFSAYEWLGNTFDYTGEQIVITFKLTECDGTVRYEYFAGADKINAIINAGKYTVRAYLISDNYVLEEDGVAVEYVQQTVTVNKIDFNPAAFGMELSKEYTGSGLSAVGTPLPENFKVQYLRADGSAMDELPVDAKAYTLLVTDGEGNYNDYKGTFTVTPKTLGVTWSGDDYSYYNGGVYVWLYDNLAHAPKALVADGDKQIAVTVTGGRSALGDYTVTAVVADSNYALDGTATAQCRILRSRVTSVVWKEYGGAVVADGVPNYQWIAVYGEKGPKLSARGVLEPNDGSAFTSEKTPEIALNVAYSAGNANLSGYWYTEEYLSANGAQKHTATASNPTQPANCVLSGSLPNLTQDFTVSKKLIQTEVSYDDIRWVVFEDGGSFEEVDGVARFVYNGKAQSPSAIVVLDKDKFPQAGSFKTLAVSGAQTDAGSGYFAYIATDNAYSVDPAAMRCGFEIAAYEINEIVWEGNLEGAFEWVYDGKAHAPKAYGVAGTEKIALEVTAAVNAGNYVARVAASANYIIGDDAVATHKYVINKLDISDGVVWDAAGGNSVEGEDGAFSHFEYAYDGLTAFAPSASFSVEAGGETFSGALAVVGKTAKDGEHIAYAYLPAGGNANLSLDFAKSGCKFVIVREQAVEVLWAADEDSEAVSGELYFTYDGKPHTPYAYFIGDGGEKVKLNVLGSGTDAGVYRAVVHDSRYAFADGAVKEFTVRGAVLTVVVEGDKFVYDGTAKSPVISFVAADGAAVEGVEYSITSAVNAGSHTAVVGLSSGNYVLEDDSVEFTIEKRVLSVVWAAQTAFAFNGKAHSPVVSGCVFDGTPVGSSSSGAAAYNVTVIGAETGVGSYTAYAVVDNENYTLLDAERAFAVTPFVISAVSWADGGADEFVYEYDGATVHKPSASFNDWAGEEVALEVVGGEINAGEHTAEAVAPNNCVFAEGVNLRKFTVNPTEISDLIWSYDGAVVPEGKLTVTYDGAVPKLSVVANGNASVAIIVTGVGSDAGTYTAVAQPANSGNVRLSGNVEYTVEIVPMEVTVDWAAGDNDCTVEGTAFSWVYDGREHCVTASFKGLNGEEFPVTVSGGSASNVGEHIVKAVNLLGNYRFIGGTDATIEITPQGIEFVWEAAGATAVNDDGSGGFSHFKYVYGGGALLPVIKAEGAGSAKFVYSVTDGAGNPVAAAVNAGTYFVTARVAQPSSYAFEVDGVVDADNAVSVKFVIEKREVEVVWGATELVYCGAAVSPEAWFVDVNNQAVKLDVSGAQTEVGSGYEATADFINGALGANYVLKNASAEFSIERKFVDKVEWDGDNNMWIVPKQPEPAVISTEAEKSHW